MPDPDAWTFRFERVDRCDVCYGQGRHKELYTDDVVADAVRTVFCRRCEGTGEVRTLLTVREVDYEAAAKASVGDGYQVEDFHRKIARQIVGAALGDDVIVLESDETH